MFLPANQPSLRAVITYYSATANVNQEGDVHINDTLQGFGITPLSLHQRAPLRRQKFQSDGWLFGRCN